MYPRVILLLFSLCQLSAPLEDIPPAPTISELDISAFPVYVQKLLANVPHSKHSEPLEPSKPPKLSKKPNTYGFSLRSDKGDIWNNIGGKHIYTNDIAPSKSISPNLLHSKPSIHSNFTRINKYEDLKLPKTLPEEIPALVDQKNNGYYSRIIPPVIPLKSSEVLSNTPTVNSVDNALKNKENIDNSTEISEKNIENNNYNPIFQIITEKNPTKDIKKNINAENDSKVKQNTNLSAENEKEEIIANTDEKDIKVNHKFNIPQTLPDKIRKTNVNDQRFNTSTEMDTDNEQETNNKDKEREDQNYNIKKENDLEVKQNTNISAEKVREDSIANTNGKDINGGQKLPSNQTLNPGLDSITDQTLPNNITINNDNDQKNNTSADNKHKSNNTTDENKEENKGIITEKDVIEKSFDYISTLLEEPEESKKNQSYKTYGMKLRDNHGYIWNDLSKPGVHYNVGEMETPETTNTTTIIAEPTTESSTEKSKNTTTDTNTVNISIEANKTANEKPTEIITPVLDDLLIKYIEKLVKEEVAKAMELCCKETVTNTCNSNLNTNGSYENTINDNKKPAEVDEINAKACNEENESYINCVPNTLNQLTKSPDLITAVENCTAPHDIVDTGEAGNKTITHKCKKSLKTNDNKINLKKNKTPQTSVEIAKCDCNESNVNKTSVNDSEPGDVISIESVKLVNVKEEINATDEENETTQTSEEICDCDEGSEEKKTDTDKSSENVKTKDSINLLSTLY